MMGRVRLSMMGRGRPSKLGRRAENDGERKHEYIIMGSKSLSMMGRVTLHEYIWKLRFGEPEYDESEHDWEGA